jgi:single-strand DNA-binding protein
LESEKERENVMNKVVLLGRLTKDPEVRYSQGENASAISRITLAIDRRFKRDGEQSADFINCVAFGKTAEFQEKYFRKGTKVAITGRIQTGSYVNKDGNKVYTTDVIVEEQEFAESKNSGGGNVESAPSVSDGFMNMNDIPDDMPFNWQ